jgi:pimeloyl-ACP methyl ester carboxylesterase
MVAGREEIYFGHTFASKTAIPGAIPRYAVDVYVDQLRDPATLRAGFEYYRTLETSAEHALRRRDEGPLTIPALATGGRHSTGTMPEETMRLVATDATGLVVPDAGHFLPEEALQELGRALLEFLR